jgi:hypothetical protein
VFIETLSATMGSDVSNRMQLNGLTAKYEVVAKQGTPKISPLAFSNPEAISIHNMVMGAQQIRSVRLSPLPKSLTLVTLENRAYEIGKTPSSGIVNSGFQRIDGTTVSMGSRRNEYATLRGKVFMNNKEIKDVEKYDRLANILGKSDWEALKADPKFADFIAGTERVFVYDIVTDQVQAPAQPTRGVPTTMTLKEYADKTSARFVETREVLRKDNIEYYNDRVNDLIEGRLKYAIFASEDLKNRQYLPFINKLKENGFEPVKGMEYILSKGGVNPKDEYTKLMTQPTTSIKPGVQELFDSNPELADEVYEALGFFKSKQQKTETPEEFEKRTGRRMKMWEYMKNMAPDDTEITDKQHQQALQQYSAYLDSIFPDSKVKEILYHMTSDSGKKGIEEKGRFLKPGEVGYQKSDYVTTGGIYFTDNNFYDEETKMYGSPISGAFGSAFISAILNIKNPLIDLTKSFGDISKVDLKGHDGFVGTNESKEIGVLEPDQIHILGSKQDIEGFKKFVGKPTAPVQSTTVSTAQMPSVNDPEVNEIIKQKEEDSKDCNNPT